MRLGQELRGESETCWARSLELTMKGGGETDLTRNWWWTEKWEVDPGREETGTKNQGECG